MGLKLNEYFEKQIEDKKQKSLDYNLSLESKKLIDECRDIKNLLEKDISFENDISNESFFKEIVNKTVGLLDNVIDHFVYYKDNILKNTEYTKKTLTYLKIKKRVINNKKDSFIFYGLEDKLIETWPGWKANIVLYSKIFNDYNKDHEETILKVVNAFDKLLVKLINRKNDKKLIDDLDDFKITIRDNEIFVDLTYNNIDKLIDKTSLRDKEIFTNICGNANQAIEGLEYLTKSFNIANYKNLTYLDKLNNNLDIKLKTLINKLKDKEKIDKEEINDIIESIDKLLQFLEVSSVYRNLYIEGIKLTEKVVNILLEQINKK